MPLFNKLGSPIRISVPYLYSMAEGDIDDHRALSIDGFNEDVDATFEDLISFGGIYVVPAAGGIQMEVVSSAVGNEDSSAGTGVRTVGIHYLDANWVEKIEVVTMNGTTPVATVATDMLRVNAFHTESVGSVGSAVGNIDIRAVSDTPIYGRIPIGYNEQHQCFYSVPSGCTAYVTSWQCSVVGAKSATFSLEATVDADGDIVTNFHSLEGWRLQNQGMYIPIAAPYKIPEKCDIKIRVKSASVNAIVSGLFEGWLESD